MAWTLLQIVVDIGLLLGVTILWLRLKRPPQDDPRLSRGLQLLQSKITVLEDLSDRTDHQVKQLTALLEHKTRQIQEKILEAERQGLKIEESMHKSLEVAEIFQDKIPHSEIMERQRTIEYVKAARMAHGGANLEDIARSVDLPREQVEPIAKFNREQLMFDEESLPEWAKQGDVIAGPSPAQTSSMPNLDFLNSLETPQPDLTGLENLGHQFKQSIKDFEEENAAIEPVQKPMPTPAASPEMKTTARSQILSVATGISKNLMSSAANLLDIQDTDMLKAAKESKPVVRKVEFPRIQAPPKA